MPKYDRRALLDDIPQTCNATNGRIEQTCLYLDDQSAADWLAVCSVCASLRQAGAVDLRLYLLDISHCLLAVAHKHAIESFGGAVHVDALRGDFHHMGRYPVLLYPPDPIFSCPRTYANKAPWN